ncbi:MAG: hypothetical protein DMG31_16095 [Acidobacteria bacterium]|nr:MAG: hypothetical protein DMG31_16095 [Acidobacteriota bacterium]
MVGRDDGSRAGTRMIQRAESVGVGSVVLLEHRTVGGIGRERHPRPILGEWVLRTDEAGGGDRSIADRHDRHEHDSEQSDRESAQRTEGAQRASQFTKVHGGASSGSMAS